MLYTPKIIKLAEREPFELTWSNGLLLRSTNWLGDALMTLPAAYQMSRLLPKSCGFFVLCPNFLVPLWEACPWVSCAIGMKEKRISAEESPGAMDWRSWKRVAGTSMWMSMRSRRGPEMRLR